MSELSTLNHVQQTLSIDYFPQISFLKEFLAKVGKGDDLSKKETLLDGQGKVNFLFLRYPKLYDLIQSFTECERVVFKSLILIDQLEHLISHSTNEEKDLGIQIKQFVVELCDVETFYSQLGGIIGYHLNCLELIVAKKKKDKIQLNETFFYPPKGFDITKKTLENDQMILEGIRGFKNLALLLPAGGAADRLNLHDEKTDVDLPAACLEFLGRSLLEGIVRDLIGKEYLHYKLFGEEISIPIGLMTSSEKNNHNLIYKIIEEKKFFGKKRESFKLFSQPLVPTIGENGCWILKNSQQLLLKPGGHGVIWKLAKDSNILEWFKDLGKRKILVRQINNPIAGVDHGITSLIGYGRAKEKSLGFASCQRRINTSEGMNIIKEVNRCITLSCIEYCDFEKFGIKDLPKSEDEPYSIFPSNTNIIYANIEAVEEAIKTNPFPGPLVNFKKMQALDEHGQISLVPIARLELLMQNIADSFSVNGEEERSFDDLPVFVTFNERCKTISPTKKEFVPGSGLVETAFGCFYDYLKNCKDLLDHYCHFSLPEIPSEEDFLTLGPSFILSYHPALGPHYQIIAQKIRRGSFSFGSELLLEIADVSIEDLDLSGSLIIEANQIVGHQNEQATVYSDLTGRVVLKNVKILNRGIVHSPDNIYWKNKVEREESCFIQLLGFSEFIAENVTLEGDYHIVVKDGERVTAVIENEQLIFKKELLDKKNIKSFWNYKITEAHHIELIK